MSGRRARVAIVYGGRSAERDVSLMSARTVAAAMDPEKYERVLISIDERGRWSLSDAKQLLGEEGAALAGRLEDAMRGSRVAITPDGADSSLVVRGSNAMLRGIDVLFPLLHGPYGEDGSIQGLARLADLPCVGADLLGSALCMDKDASKRILREAGIAVAPFIAFASRPVALGAWPEVRAALGLDLFVKPANLGSSVGISRARSKEEYEAAVELAFRYDSKVLVERRMEGREIEVAVLGHRELRASLPGEVLPKGSFYSYEAKYLDESGAEIAAPARLSEREAEACMTLALDACRLLCVRGMARVDLFLGWDGRPAVNEVNTIPGFTARSMYPLLWEASGLPLRALVDELIEAALEAYAERAALWSAPPVA
jgi:D-alanine-D-alanine ligase